MMTAETRGASPNPPRISGFTSPISPITSWLEIMAADLKGSNVRATPSVGRIWYSTCSRSRRGSSIALASGYEPTMVKRSWVFSSHQNTGEIMIPVDPCDLFDRVLGNCQVKGSPGWGGGLIGDILFVFFFGFHRAA